MTWTAVAKRSGDTAFERAVRAEISMTSRASKSGVALRFPPQSMTRTGLPNYFTMPIGYAQARNMVFPPERIRR